MLSRLRKHGPAILTGCCTLLLLLAFYGPTDNWSWDPSYYYAHIRAPVIDGDFDFRDETIPQGQSTIETATGVQPSLWPVGPSVLWAPFLLVAHSVALLAPWFAADGFSLPYIALVSAGSALYGSLGLLINYRLCRLAGSAALSAVAVGLVLLATPLFFYVVRQPIMAHSTSYLAAVLLLLACMLVDRGSIPLERSGLLLGALFGLQVLTRWSSVVFVLLPAGLLLCSLVQAVWARNPHRALTVIVQGVLAVVAAALVLLPQFAMSYRLYAEWVIVSPYQVVGFDTSQFLPNLAALLLHSNRGILVWTPFVVLGVLGLVRLRSRRLRVLLLLCAVAHGLLLATRIDWFGGGGYSTRYFIELLPLVSIGFVALFQGQPYQQAPWHWRWRWLVVGVLAVGLIIQQFGLLIAVEQARLPLAAYMEGRPLGLALQRNSVLALSENPAALLRPRPYVQPERQAVLVNYLAGSRNRGDYTIPLVGVMLVPCGLIAGDLYRRWRGVRALGDLTKLLLVYSVGWGLFFLVR